MTDFIKLVIFTNTVLAGLIQVL